MNEGSFTATSPTTLNVPGADRWLLYETAVDPAPDAFPLALKFRIAPSRAGGAQGAHRPARDARPKQRPRRDCRRERPC